MKTFLLGLFLILLAGEARSQQTGLDTFRSGIVFPARKTALPYSPLVSRPQPEHKNSLRADSVRSNAAPIKIPLQRDPIYFGPTPPRNSIYLIRIKIK